MAYLHRLLHFLLNNNVALLVLYSLLRYYYSDLIPPSEWMPLLNSIVDPKPETGFPSIQEVDGKWVVVCGGRYNALPAPS